MTSATLGRPEHTDWRSAPVLLTVDPSSEDDLPVDQAVTALREVAGVLKQISRRPRRHWLVDVWWAILKNPLEALVWLLALVLLGWLMASFWWQVSVGGRPGATLTILGGSQSATRYADPGYELPSWALRMEEIFWFGAPVPQTDE